MNGFGGKEGNPLENTCEIYSNLDSAWSDNDIITVYFFENFGNCADYEKRKLEILKGFAASAELNKKNLHIVPVNFKNDSDIRIDVYSDEKQSGCCDGTTALSSKYKDLATIFFPRTIDILDSSCTDVMHVIDRCLGYTAKLPYRGKTPFMKISLGKKFKSHHGLFSFDCEKEGIYILKTNGLKVRTFFKNEQDEYELLGSGRTLKLDVKVYYFKVRLMNGNKSTIKILEE